MDASPKNEPADVPAEVGVVGDGSNPHRRRPGRGLVTFLAFLMTGLGIALFAIQGTRRAALTIFLPCYAIFLLGYLWFLCVVKSIGEVGDEPQPAALTEYLMKKKKKRQSRRKKRHVIVEPPKAEIFQDDMIKSESFKIPDATQYLSSTDITLTIAESLSTDDSALHHATFTTTTNGSDEPDENFFIQYFPSLSKSFEDVESQFHTIAMHIKRQVLPSPVQCTECRNGSHSHDDSTACAENHVDVNTPALTEIENDQPTDEESADRVVEPAPESLDEILISPTPVNLTGKFKLVHNLRFTEFLKSLNISSLLARAANASKPIHTYYHDGDDFHVQVDGIVKGGSKFIIGGPPCASNIRHLHFDDYCTLVDNGQAVQVRKVGKNVPPNSPVEIIVRRELGNNGHNLIISSKAIYADGSETLECIQTFHRLK
jgi:hypothetical protein